MRYRQNILQFIFFCLLFSALDYVYLFSDYYESDYDALTVAIMDDSVGYNNLYMIAGIVVTVIYILSLNRINFINNPAFVLRKGKRKYLKYLAGDALISAVLISFEFVGAEALICSVRFKNELLTDTGFYVCCVLYMIMLFGYFSIVGISTVLIDIAFGRGKASSIVSSALFIALNSLILLDINISPLYYSQFISYWFSKGEFNYLEYIINIVKCFCVFAAIYCIAEFALLRKDLIFDEQQN